jgi:hypothetical protein
VDEEMRRGVAVTVRRDLPSDLDDLVLGASPLKRNLGERVIRPGDRGCLDAEPRSCSAHRTAIVPSRPRPAPLGGAVVLVGFALDARWEAR